MKFVTERRVAHPIKGKVHQCKERQLRRAEEEKAARPV